MLTATLIVMTAVVAGIMILSFKFKTPPNMILTAAGASFLMIVGHAGMGLAISSRFARFDWDSPKHMLEGGISYLLSFLSIVGGLLGTGFLLFGVLYLNAAYGLIMLAVYSTAMLIFSILFSMQRLQKIEWLF